MFGLFGLLDTLLEQNIWVDCSILDFKPRLFTAVHTNIYNILIRKQKIAVSTFWHFITPQHFHTIFTTSQRTLLAYQANNLKR